VEASPAGQPGRTKSLTFQTLSPYTSRRSRSIDARRPGRETAGQILKDFRHVSAL
jgi:hypothetical protein